MVVWLEPEDNGGAGYRVTAVDYATDTLTVSPVLAGILVGGDVVIAVVPTQTTAGTRVGTTENELTIDAAAIGGDMIMAKFAHPTGIIPLGKSSASAKPVGIVRTKRPPTTMQYQGYLTDATAIYPGGGWNDTLLSVVARYGPNTTAKNMYVSCLAMRLNVTSLPDADDNAIEFDIDGEAQQSAAAGDEFTISFP